MRKIARLALLGPVISLCTVIGLAAAEQGHKKPPLPAMPFHHRFGPHVQAYDPASVLVKFRTNFTEADRKKFQAQVKVFPADPQTARAAFHAYYHTRPQGQPVFGWQRVRLPAAGEAAAAQLELGKNALVEAVELNYYAYAALESTTYTARANLDDLYYHDGYSQWWLNRTAGDDAVNGAHPFMGSAVTVAVLDTGVQLDHPEFAGRLVNGYHAITPAAQPVDDDGHGTFVAGMLVANVNNHSMIAGTAFNTQIKVMPVKVLDYTGKGNFLDIASGIQWAADHGVNVMNMSFGAYNTNSVLLNAITYAANSGCFLVAAAGNDAKDLTSDPFYPAAYNAVMAVGATDAQDFITGYSNRGLGIIDLAAPGGDMTYPDVSFRDNGIVGTYLGSTVAAMDGTSFASPQAAAEAALLLLQDPNRTVNDVWTIMINHCDNFRDETSQYIGAGRINLHAALSVYLTATPGPSFTTTPSRTRTATATQTFTASPTPSVSPTTSATHTCSPVGSATPTSTPIYLEEKEISVFPQPGKDHVRLLFDFHPPGRVLAEIYNVVGERVLRKEDAPMLVNGGGRLDVETRNVGPGIYYLKLTITDAVGRHQLTKRISVIH